MATAFTRRLAVSSTRVGETDDGRTDLCSRGGATICFESRAGPNVVAGREDDRHAKAGGAQERETQRDGSQPAEWRALVARRRYLCASSAQRSFFWCGLRVPKQARRLREDSDLGRIRPVSFRQAAGEGKVPKLGKSGSVRGALSNEGPYRDRRTVAPEAPARPAFL